jgi:CHASE2 domain-containing sensor protein
MNLKRNGSWFSRDGAAGAALAAAAGLLMLASPAGSGLVGLSYDWLFRFRENVPVDGVTILYMDLESETRMDQKRRQSWDRTIHARMLERLKELRPAAVVFDVLFIPSNDDPKADARLVQAAKAAGNVIVAAKPTPDLHEGEIVGWQLTLPFPGLREAVSWGVVEAADSDKSIREHYHRKDFEAPSMAWRAAQRATTNAPADPYARRWINFYGPPGHLRHFSYADVFETDRVPLAAISNQVVFVGALYDIGFAGGKRSDDFRTPYTRWTGRRSPGVEVTATAYLNFVRGDWLRRLPSWLEACLVVLCGALLGFGLIARRPMTAAGLGLVAFAVTSFATILASWSLLTWFPWLIVGVVQIPFALGWAVLCQTRRLHREKRALEQTLAMAQAGGDSSRQEASSPAAGVIEAAPAVGGSWLPVGVGSSARSSEPLRRVEEQATIGALASDGKPTVSDHEMIRCIGRGAYGEVWLARDIIGTYHAVKVVYRNSFTDAVPFEREFNGIRRFTPISRSHPGFVHVLQVGLREQGDYLYYVMELGDDEAAGQNIDPGKYSPKTLSRELHRRGRLPLVECVRLGVQLADALHYLHEQQLIHRDIKPSNIIYVNGAPKFADIGLVTGVATEGRDVTYLGTKGFIAPEGPGTPAADVFSLGKVIFEIAFGVEAARFPELPTTMVQSADASGLFLLNRIVLKACEADACRRYESAAELKTALAELLPRLDPSSHV